MVEVVLPPVKLESCPTPVEVPLVRPVVVPEFKPLAVVFPVVSYWPVDVCGAFVVLVNPVVVDVPATPDDPGVW